MKRWKSESLLLRIYTCIIYYAVVACVEDVIRKSSLWSNGVSAPRLPRFMDFVPYIRRAKSRSFAVGYVICYKEILTAGRVYVHVEACIYSLRSVCLYTRLR